MHSLRRWHERPMNGRRASVLSVANTLILRKCKPIISRHGAKAVKPLQITARCSVPIATARKAISDPGFKNCFKIMAKRRSIITIPPFLNVDFQLPSEHMRIVRERLRPLQKCIQFFCLYRFVFFLCFTLILLKRIADTCFSFGV